jgi:apolipoprotein D and lipocalin family protein
MKKGFSAFVILLILATQAFAQGKAIETVATVDLNRYAGKWFEIARFSNWFQKQCAGEVTAEYRERKDGNIDVVNRCQKTDGTFEEIVGIAKVADAENKAKLKVSFAPDWMSWLPMVWGDYWIIALAPDYSYALVGVPGRKYLWVLSRTPTMQKEAYDEAVKRAAQQGFDVSKLVKTRQGK